MGLQRFKDQLQMTALTLCPVDNGDKAVKYNKKWKAY